MPKLTARQQARLAEIVLSGEGWSCDICKTVRRRRPKNAEDVFAAIVDGVMAPGITDLCNECWKSWYEWTDSVGNEASFSMHGSGNFAEWAGHRREELHETTKGSQQAGPRASGRQERVADADRSNPDVRLQRRRDRSRNVEG